jgi:hypothetical protein
VPASSFSASAACTLPMMPTSGANTPMVAQARLLEGGIGREQAGVAGRSALARVVHRDLAVEADGRARHQRHAVRARRPR